MPERGWVDAGELQVGVALLTRDQNIVRVEAIEQHNGEFTVYNFEVEEFHTYFVSRLGILVHNADYDTNLINAQRQQHILAGDATGGGHRPGLGIPGKTEFPPSWSDEQILDAITDVATNPSSQWTQITGAPGAKFTKSGKPVRWQVKGTMNGVDIKVIIEPDGQGIITGYPTNLPSNP